MEENKVYEFRPNPKLNVIGLWFMVIIGVIGFIISMVLTGKIIAGFGTVLPILLPLLVINVTGYIKKKYSIYYIKGSEIEIYYKFISKSRKIIRMNLLTSVSVKRNWFQKMFGLGSVTFGIFGKSSVLGNTNTATAGNVNAILNQAFVDLDNPEEAFKVITNKIGVSATDVVYEDKPSLSPNYFFRKIWAFFTFGGLISVALGLYVYFVLKSDVGILFATVGAMSFIFFVWFFIFECFDISKVKSTKYRIYSDKLRVSHSYIFGSSCVDVPIAKITNTEAHKNLIGWALFKVGSLSIMTGGNNDPRLRALEKFELFAEKLSSKYSKDVLNKVQSSEDVSIKSASGADYVTNPKGSFFVGVLLWMSVFFLFPALHFLVFANFEGAGIIGSVLIILYVIVVGWRYLLWKNTSYEFYSDRIVDKSGVINIKTKEIYFKNIRYVRLTRSYFFERMMGQGSIHIYTAGTGSLDNSIAGVDEFAQIYKELKHLIEDKVNHK